MQDKTMKELFDYTKWTIYEWIFYFILIIICFLPARFTTVLEIWNGQLLLGDALIILLFICLISLFVIQTPDFRIQNVIFLLFSFIIFWAFISLAWESGLQISISYLIFPLIITWVTMTVGYLFAKLAANQFISWELMTRLSLFLTIVLFIYALESLVGIGLRSVAGSAVTESLGIQRMKGPLGASSTIHIVILPVMAVHLGNIMSQHKPRFIYLSAFIITGICLVISGSRSGLLAGILFFVGLAITQRSMKLVIFLIFGSLIIIGPLLTQLSFDRFANLEDLDRADNYLTAWKVSTESTSHLLFGTGYGGVWPWYSLDVKLFSGELHYAEVLTRFIPEGKVLFHPHSLFFALLSEMGLLPPILFIVICLLLVFKFWAILNDAFSKVHIYLLCGVLSVVPTFLLDTFLLKNWKVSMIWWLFLFLGLTINSKSHEIERK